MPKRQHPNLHPDWIDDHASGIVRALQKKKYETYLVGGCVRDLLLGIHPKDYDIATTAHPEDVRKVIHKAYVIGKRFRLVLVKRNDQQYEVATFRKNVEDFVGNEDDLPEGDNLFGTPQEDAMRRDFTINGMFYDPVGDQLIDHTNGLEDLEAGLIRMIGDPETRLVEDPIRILRALRLAHKIDFKIEQHLREAMKVKASTLLESALPRRREEILKLLKLKDPALSFVEAYDLGILQYLSPVLNHALSSEDSSEAFLHNLSTIGSYWVDKDSPLELFSHLVFSYLIASGKYQNEKPLRAKEILEDPEVLCLMKDELGMFKYEQALFAKAVQMQTTLTKRLDFERKGERRQFAVLKNEAFPLALKIAIQSYHLSGPDLNFWLSRFRSARPAIVELREDEKRKRRPHSRKRRRKKSTPA